MQQCSNPGADDESMRRDAGIDPYTRNAADRTIPEFEGGNR